MKTLSKIKNLFSWLSNWIYVIFHPEYWCMNYPYNKQWDKTLYDLLNNNEFEIVNPCEAIIGGNRLWVANRPYCCFHPHHISRKQIIKYRASRATIRTAMKKLSKATNYDKLYGESDTRENMDVKWDFFLKQP